MQARHHSLLDASRPWHLEVQVRELEPPLLHRTWQSLDRLAETEPQHLVQRLIDGTATGAALKVALHLKLAPAIVKEVIPVNCLIIGSFHSGVRWAPRHYQIKHLCST